MIQHRDVCTHYENLEDRLILTSKSFPVNLRLLKTSLFYFEIIKKICSYIQWSATTLKEGYPLPKGWSDPNAGIPLRIIYVPPYGIMINPEWISSNNDHESEEVKSNCGSLTLKRPRSVVRAKSINIAYYTLDGQRREVTNVTKDLGGYTFQHEFLHIEGELI